MRGIRGATQVADNTPEAIKEATGGLLRAMAKENSLDQEEIVSIIFSVTPDLDAAFPAEAARDLGWVHVPLFCTREIPVPGSLKMCVRVLIHAYLDCPLDDVKHIYLQGAAILRPDLHRENS